MPPEMPAPPQVPPALLELLAAPRPVRASARKSAMGFHSSLQPPLRTSDDIPVEVVTNLVDLKQDAAVMSERRASPGLEEEQRFDFEARAPWYLYNTTAEGPPGAAHGATTVRIFEGELMQGAKRKVQAQIVPSAVPVAWGQVALRLRLAKPPGDLEYDHWDREASIGLLLREGGKNLRLFPAAQARPDDFWEMH